MYRNSLELKILLGYQKTTKSVMGCDGGVPHYLHTLLKQPLALS